VLRSETCCRASSQNLVVQAFPDRSTSTCSPMYFIELSSFSNRAVVSSGNPVLLAIAALSPPCLTVSVSRTTSKLAQPAWPTLSASVRETAS
jgi:hypothetical protein